ncbi:MAG: hypothetical protein WAL29_08325, partial [Bacteroidales bacterium]
MSQIMKLFAFASSLPDEIKQTGRHSINNLQIRLKAGAISLRFEDGALRYICNGNHEIVRMIYFAVRDSEWLTVKQKITDPETEFGENSFRLSYNSQFESEEINFFARFFIEGRADNSISFRMEGEAENTFKKNRIGFCILHPIEECAGINCKITHTDNLVEETLFPLFISPYQPFKDIKIMEWQAGSNNYLLSFSGDVFETEDQRNWTDASFKTYSTPLAVPFPVILNKGEKICQKVELRAERIDTGITKDTDKIVNIQIDLSSQGILPQVGIGHSSRQIPLSANEVIILKKTSFDHYRVDLHLYSDSWKKAADCANSDAVNIGVPLEFVLFFSEDAINQAVEFIEWVNKSHPEIALVTILDRNSHTAPCELADPVIQLMQSALPGVKTCCGTNANFAQLNRNRPEPILNDYICYSIHPQEHASDNTTLVENLSAQEYTVRSANKFAGEKGIWISPVNIQRRFNANSSCFELPYQGDEIPARVDIRLMSLFGACWT